MSDYSGNDALEQTDYLMGRYNLTRDEAFEFMDEERRRLERDRGKHQREYSESLRRRESQ